MTLGISACAGPDQGTASTPSIQASEYPAAERGDHIDTYFDTEVGDPYRWFEEMDSERTASWVTAQNDLSMPALAAVPAHATIQKRLEQLWNYERYGQPGKEGGRYFYTHNSGLQNQSVLWVTDDPAEKGEVALDPNTFSEDGTVSLAGLDISPDGSKLAYAKSDGGSDWDTWHVRDLATGEDLPDLIRYTKFTSASWTADSKGFYYSRYPVGDDGAGDDQKAVSVYYHRLGTDQDADELVMSIPEHPMRNPYATVSEDGSLLVFGISEGYLTNAISVQRTSGGPVIELLPDWDARYSFLGNIGDRLFFRTNLNAPRERVIAIDLANPADKVEILPESEDTLRSTSLVGGHLIASYLRDAQSVVSVFTPDGELVREVELPGIGTASGFGGKWDDSETFYTFSSFADPGSTYRYDVATGESTLFRQPEIAFDGSPYVTEQVFFESADGTRVPMFITHRAGLEKNGRQPTLLYGYGGFNVSLTPGFSLSRAVWLEMGGVLAVANLRGGGEYGKEWHIAGTKLEKQNVFDDFIAAAEHLIASNYTSSDRLAVQGGSNGGLLVGAVITQRPELFGAALPAVGVLDMLRYHTASANARNWSDDYGLSENEDEFRAQLAYSPVHNVPEGVCLPPTLVTTADRDDRVVPWHSFKFAAELQHRQSCSNPILARVETRAGHGAGKPTWMQIENIADQWAFLVDQLGMEIELAG